MNLSFRNDPTPVMCSTGVLFKTGNTNYLLAQVEPGKVCLIALDKYANRFMDAVLVKDPRHLTKEEWDAVTDGAGDTFEVVGVLNEVILD